MTNIVQFPGKAPSGAYDDMQELWKEIELLPRPDILPVSASFMEAFRGSLAISTLETAQKALQAPTEGHEALGMITVSADIFARYKRCADIVEGWK